MKKEAASFLVLLLTGVLHAAGIPVPVFETTFRTDASGRLLDNTPDPVTGKLTPGAAIRKSAIGNVLELEGKLNNGAVFNSAPKLLLPDKFTISGWVWFRNAPDPGGERPYRVYTFFFRGEQQRICMSDCVSTQFSADGEFFTLRTPPKTISPNAWTHLAYCYSVPEGKHYLYVNGVKQAERTASVIKKRIPPFPIPNNAPLQFGSLGYFFPLKGCIARPRVYPETMTPEQIIAGEQDMVRLLLADLERRSAAIPGTEELRTKLRRIMEQAVIPLNVLPGFYAELERFQKVQKLRKNAGTGGAPLIYSVVDPMEPDIFYRDSDLPESGRNGTIRIAAARNEYEPASFLVKALSELKRVLPVVEELKRRDGVSIPPSAIDIRLVKQIVVAGRTLSPNVLIHDDKLLKVDPLKMEMSLRLSKPEGVRYHNVTAKTPVVLPKREQTAEKFPVYDAKQLQALDLQPGVTQQFWLTLKTTPDMQPGLYSSRIRLTADGTTLCFIPLKVRILPFSLPDPKTNYDPSREFTTSVYFFDTADSGTDAGRDGAINYVMPLSGKQFQACLKNLREHGIRHPTIIMGNWFPGWNSWVKPQAPRVYPDAELMKQRMKERIAMLKEAGFPLRPLYLHTGGNVGFREFYDRKQHRELLRKFLAEGTAFYRELLGHDEIYHYGLDEAEDERLRKEFEVWEDMRAMNAKVYTTLKAANIPLVAGKVDVAVAVHKPEKSNAKLMHDNGGRLWVYAQPFASQASAYPHRKGYGYGVYFADYDGICNYSFNHWDWRTIPWDMHNQNRFYYAMPTADGIIDTPGWEGYREGIDDVRYATKLRQEILRAGSDPRKKETAEKASCFLDSVRIDTMEFDPAWTRLQIIDFILDLTEEQK